MPRRQKRNFWIGVGILLAGISFCAQAAAAQYPDRAIRLLVGFPPGGGADYVAREVAKRLTDDLGQSVVVDNKPGATGIIATEQAASAKPDGYTLLLGVTATHAISPSLYAKLSYDPVRDFTPVSEVGFTPMVLVVRSASPVKSVAEFIDYVKNQPAPVPFASAGNGNITHMAAELFKISSGAKNMMHVPYKGASPAITDLLAGRVFAYFATLPSALPLIQSGELRALGLTSSKRSSALPDVPTIQEAGVPGYEATTWFGVFGPAGMPSAITQKLSDSLQRSFSTKEARATLAEHGLEVVADTPEQFGKTLQADIEKWHKVTAESHIKLD